MRNVLLIRTISKIKWNRFCALDIWKKNPVSSWFSYEGKLLAYDIHIQNLWLNVSRLPGACCVITFGPACPCTVLAWEVFANATREFKLNVGILGVVNKFVFEATAGAAAATFNLPMVTLGCVVTIRAWAEPKTVGWDAETVDILEFDEKTVAWVVTSRAGVWQTLTGTVRRVVVTWFYKSIIQDVY